MSAAKRRGNESFPKERDSLLSSLLLQSTEEKQTKLLSTFEYAQVGSSPKLDRWINPPPSWTNKWKFSQVYCTNQAAFNCEKHGRRRLTTVCLKRPTGKSIFNRLLPFSICPFTVQEEWEVGVERQVCLYSRQVQVKPEDERQVVLQHLTVSQ